MFEEQPQDEQDKNTYRPVRLIPCVKSNSINDVVDVVGKGGVVDGVVSLDLICLDNLQKLDLDDKEGIIDPDYVTLVRWALKGATYFCWRENWTILW